jgi:CrcB protein
MNWSILIAIGSGGFLGAILRYLITIKINNSFISDFPYGTLSVNLLGSFILGTLIAFFSLIDTDEHLKLFLTTGLMGALTTYSTFAMESFLLLDKSFNLFLLNILSNLIGSILFAGIGYKLILFIKQGTI